MGFISLKPGYASPFCVESASAVSDAPRVAKPKVLRASKKVCVCGGVFSLTNAAGGGSKAGLGAGSLLAKNVLPSDGSVAAGVTDNVPVGKGSTVFTSTAAGTA